MIVRCLFTCYYWICKYVFPSNITGTKLKISDNIRYNEEVLEEALEKKEYEEKINLYMNYDEEEVETLITYNTQKFNKYNCGYCTRPIDIPIYMYNDETFCTPRCRANLIQRDENYSVKKQCVSFSL